MVAQTIGRYEVKGLLGQGGMASVYRAHDPYIERDVAIKVLPREFLHDPMFRNRFQREAKTVAGLEHPAIVPIHDFGEDDGQPFLVMRLMSGGSLAERIAQGPMPLQEVARIVDRVADALDAVHNLGIVHRDLKPNNILFDQRGNPYIADFGIVKLTESTSMLTGTGIVGTPAYMAPEMADMGGITPLVDVYALGVTTFLMLTGRLPYEAETPAGVMMAHAIKPIPNPLDIRRDLHPDVRYVIERALAKNPVDRYQSTRELADDLKALSSGLQIERVELSQDDPPSTAPMPVVKRDHDRTLVATEEELAEQDLEDSAEYYDSETEQEPYRPSWSSPPPEPTRTGIPKVLLFGGIGAAALLVVIVALVVVVLPGIARRTAEAADVPSTAPPVPTEEVQNVDREVTAEPSPTAISLQPTVQLLFGVIETLGKDATEFMALDAAQPLQTGDTIRTNTQSAALLTFASGVSAELHPDSEMRLVTLDETTGTLIVELEQTRGLSYHFIREVEGGPARDYSVQTPVAAASAVGTQFWVIEMETGWCFVPTEGTIQMDLGERDDTVSDDYLVHAGGGMLVNSDGTTGPCSTPEEQLALTDGSALLVSGEPTPTATVATGGGTRAQCGNGTCEIGAENSDLCAVDCPCRDNGACEAGEGSTCRDCSSRAGTCGAPCADSSQCAAGFACAGGACWDACKCGGQCGGDTGGGTGGGPPPGPTQPNCGACGDGGQSGWYYYGTYTPACPYDHEYRNDWYNACSAVCSYDFYCEPIIY